MGKSDVEMVDAEKVHKVVDPKEGEAAASGDVNGRENVEEDLNKVMDKKVEDEMDMKTDVEDQTNPVKEVSEQIEGSDYGIVITGRDNKELINTGTVAEAQTTSAVEKRGDLKFEKVDPNSGVKEDEPAKNDEVDVNQGGDVGKGPDEDVDVKSDVVECDATNSRMKEDELTKNDEVDGNQGEDIDKRPNEDVDVKFEVVECDATKSGVKEDEPSKNDMLDGNQGKDAEKTPNEDVVKKPGEIGKHTDETKHVASETMVENVDAGNVPSQNRQLPTESFANKDPQGHNAEVGDVRPGEDEEMEDSVHCDQDKMVKDNEQGEESCLVSHETHGNENFFETAAKLDAEESSLASQPEPCTPNPLIRCSSQKTADHSGETAHTVSSQGMLAFVRNIMFS